jgi:O-methyltransferase
MPSVLANSPVVSRHQEPAAQPASTPWPKEVGRAKGIYTLNIANYAPEITALTYPLIERYAEKIGADFYVIDERQYPGWPVVYEKLQIHRLAREHGREWILYFDSDALVHPDLFDVTEHLPKDTVMHNGVDLAGNRWAQYDRFFRRDGRHIGSCFPAGTMVAGGCEPIEAVMVGSAILNSAGLHQTVEHKFEREYSGEMVSLKVACLPSIDVTAEHPILVCSMKNRYPRKPARFRMKVPTIPTWKAAGQVEVGDWVIVPRNKKYESARLSFNVQGGAGHPGPRRRIDVALDEDTAWLVGLYVAEGYTSEDNRINLSLGSTEIDLAERAAEIFRKLGVRARIDHKKLNRGVLTVVVNCAGLARVFDEWCGSGAVNKRVPVAILHSTLPIARAFIEGLVAGDGCSFTNKRGGAGYRLVTVSRGLVFSVIELLHKFGMHVSGGNPRNNSPTIEGREVNTHPVYEVNWSKHTWDGTLDKQGREAVGIARFTDDYVYLPVRGVEHSAVSGMRVFNIETQDHTYAVPFIVHNCNWFSVASDWCIDLWEPLSDLTLDEAVSNIRLTQSEVSSGVLSADHLIDDFVLSRNVAKYGLKFTTFTALLQKLGHGGGDYLRHAYTLTTSEKVAWMRTVLAQWNLDVDAEFFRQFARSREAGLLLSPERAKSLWKHARACAGLDGEFWECGVFRGGSANLIAAAASPAVFRLFDTFEGFPDQIRDVDFKGCDFHGWPRVPGLVAAKPYEAATFLDAYEGITFHPGIVPDSLVPYGYADTRQTPIAFAHLDMDLYEPTAAAIDFIWPRLVEGAHLVIDDYASEWEGVTKAVNERFRGGSFEVLTGQCTAVKGQAVRVSHGQVSRTERR